MSDVCKLKALHNVPSSRIHSSNYWKVQSGCASSSWLHFQIFKRAIGHLEIAERHRANWKLPVWCRPLVSKTTSCVQPAAFRHLAEMSAISWTMWNWSARFRRHFKCWVLRLLAHAWVSHTSADTHGCPFHQEPLDFPQGFFQAYTSFATQTPATWASGLCSLPFVSAELSQTGSLF